MIGFIVVIVIVGIAMFGALILSLVIGEKIEDIPRKNAESRAGELVNKFKNSPAAVYSASEVVKSMSCEIEHACRSTAQQTVKTFFAFSVEIDEVRSHDPTKWETANYIASFRTYNFCANRYPNLTDAADRTALARAIRIHALNQLTQKYPKDPSGSTDVKFTYYEDIQETRTAITLYYQASNQNYIEYRSW